MKKFSILFLIILLGILTFFPLTSFLSDGLVPCGGEGEPACTLCHLFVLFQNILNFIFFKIVPPLAILMIAIAGIMFMFAYFGGPEGLAGGQKGGPAMLNQARRLLSSVIIGLLIIYGAWLFVNLFFLLIGVADWTGLFPEKDPNTGEWTKGWFKINCPY